jgi:hypothetical protein
VLLDIQDDIQPNDIHLLEGALWSLQHALENRIELLGCPGAF